MRSRTAHSILTRWRESDGKAPLRILDNIHGALYRRGPSPDSAFQYLSNGILKLTGYSAADYSEGRVDLQSLLTSHDAQERRHEIEQCLEQRCCFNLEYRIHARGGSRPWLREQGMGVYDNRGRAIAIDGLMTDITGLKHRHKRKEDEFALLVHSVEDYAIFMLDLQGRIVTWNKGAERIKGYSEDEIIGKHFSIFYPPEDVESGKPELGLKMAQEKGFYEDEGWRLRKDGSRFMANTVLTAIYDHQKKLVGYAKVTRDLRKRRETAELQRAVRERTKKLEETIADLETFSYTASHDLRAPLRTIEGYSNILLRDLNNVLNEENRDKLLRLGKAAQRLDLLIGDLITYGHISQMDLKMDIVELDELVSELVDQRLWGNCGIRVQSPLGQVYGQRSMLSQAIGNLLENACKFTRPNELPEVVLWTEVRGAKLRLWVQDNGIGIESHVLPKIFRPFTRGQPREYPGTGIGLAIVKRSITRLGGTVGVESQPGRGSRFWIELQKAS